VLNRVSIGVLRPEIWRVTRVVEEVISEVFKSSFLGFERGPGGVW